MTLKNGEEPMEKINGGTGLGRVRNSVLTHTFEVPVCHLHQGVK